MLKQKRDVCQYGVCYDVGYHHNKQEKATMTKGMTYSFDFCYHYLCNCIPALIGITLVYTSPISCLDHCNFLSSCLLDFKLSVSNLSLLHPELVEYSG